MQDDAGFYAPLQYQSHWLWLGLFLMLLVAGWYVWVLRPARTETPTRSATSLPGLDALRAACLAAIDATASDTDAGRIPERDAHQRLSYLLREFAQAASGLPATSMTLEELRHQGLDELAAGIAGIYPNEFAPVQVQSIHVQSIHHSAEAARRVVRAWN
ncbi:hypothetical protein [Paenarthrobacter sp. FR1]|uniref:hypothetical protein n=1 Tax=Paenarthrobacter sp. FR1 TaxID=3439548 RepID=UPI003DA55334